MMNPRNVLLTALAPIIWGSTYIVTTECLPPDRPFIAAMLRTLPSGILLTLLVRQLPARDQWGRLAVLSALNIGVFQALLFVAAYRLPGGLAAVLGAIQPLLVMTLGWAVDGRPAGWGMLTAGVLGVLGMAALLLSPGAVWDPIGIAAAVGGAACMAAGTFLGQRWRTDVPLLALTGWQLLAGGAMLLPVALAVDPPLPPLDTGAVLGYAYLALIGAVLSYALWFRGVARLPPVAMSSLLLLSPLTAVIIGWAVLGQRITGVALVGLVTVFASILWVQMRTRTPSTSSHPVAKGSTHVQHH